MRKPLPHDGTRCFWAEHEVDHWIKCRIRGVDPASAPAEEPRHPRLIPQREVLRRVGFSRVTLWRLEQQGAFPRRVRLDSASLLLSS
jgi:predicted DNA-binding transcriptional regulator AlpA